MRLKCLKHYPELKINDFYIILLFSAISVCFSCQKNMRVEKQIVNFMQNSDSDTLVLRNLTSFKWNEVWIVPRSSMLEACFEIMKKRDIDVKDKQIESVRWSEYLDLMIFTDSKKIVYYCYPPVKDSRTIDWYPLFQFERPDGYYDVFNLSKDNAIFLRVGKHTLMPINANEIYLQK